MGIVEWRSEKRLSSGSVKVSYNRESDVLLIQVSEAKVDYAEEMGPIIVHFTKDGKPVLLEILDASELFLKWQR